MNLPKIHCPKESFFFLIQHLNICSTVSRIFLTLTLPKQTFSFKSPRVFHITNFVPEKSNDVSLVSEPFLFLFFRA